VYRLNPEFAGRSIGCLIIVRAGNEDYVYQEKENTLEVDQVMTWQEFQDGLKNVSQADKNLFYKSLD
jgi:hypothetical protein